MFAFSQKRKKPDPNINMGEYDPGDIDPTTGREMIYICYQTPLFLVSIDSDYSLNWFGGEDLNYAADFGEVTSQVNLTEALVDRIFVGKKNKFAYKKILGDVLSTLLDDEDSKTARLILAEAKDRVIAHCKERIRMAYISYAILGVVLTGLLVTLTVLLRPEILQFVKIDIYRIMVCTLLGGVGAFITTFARFKDYQGSFIAGLPIHRLDGFLRVFYGLVAGIIISLAIKSKMLAGFASDGTEPWLLYFFAMIAGASEILIPNLVKQVEDETVIKKPGATPKADTEPVPAKAETKGTIPAKSTLNGKETTSGTHHTGATIITTTHDESTVIIPPDVDTTDDAGSE